MGRRISKNQAVSEGMLPKARRLRREMTPEEAILWRVLRGGRFAGLHFRRQQVIGPYIAEFCCLSAGVIIEIDGAHHQQQQAYDAVRDEYLVSHNLYVLRVSNQQVRDDLSGVFYRP